MYESPITIKVSEIIDEIVGAQDEKILRAVQRVVPEINEEELIKALRFDRGQYERGYEDARRELVSCEECRYWSQKAGSTSRLHVCAWHGDETTAVDFCSRGCRKEGRSDV